MDLTEKLEFIGLSALFKLSYIINEPIQQVKHGYFHMIKDTKHRRVCRDSYVSDPFFDHLTGYSRKWSLLHN